ncbi:MAG: tyrosine-type recombinase/integrase [Thaumarchaeota archaeon]|nr:tyrosine-type recombinase/integrase [Nitrososphaerota archaeon]
MQDRIGAVAANGRAETRADRRFKKRNTTTNMSYEYGRKNLEPDIHGYAKRVRNALIQIEHWDMNEQDRQDIIKFSTLLRVQGLNLGRVAKYMYSLKVIAKFLQQLDPGITYRTATKDHIEQFYLHIMEEADYTPHTKRDYVTTLKRFYQWLKAPSEEYTKWRRKHTYPPEVDDLNGNIKLNERFLPSDLFTEDEVNRMIETTSFVMVKAAIGVMDEIGPRPGEFLNTKIGDLTFLSNGMVQLRLGHNGGGKTGERLVYLVKSVTLLTSWLNVHPFRNDLDSPLWVNLWNPKFARHIGGWSYNAMHLHLRDTAEKAGIKKKAITAYLFRHTAATRDARNGFNEALLCKKYGWAIGSKMPRIYIHLAGNDLQAKTAQVYGGIEIEKPRPQTLKCPKCKLENHPTNQCCSRCGSILDMAQVIDIEQRDLQTNTHLAAMQKEIDQLMELLNQNGLGKEAESIQEKGDQQSAKEPIKTIKIEMTEEEYRRWKEARPD